MKFKIKLLFLVFTSSIFSENLSQLSLEFSSNLILLALDKFY